MLTTLRPTLFLLVFLLGLSCGSNPRKPGASESVPVFIPKGPAQTRLLSDARIHGITALSYFKEGQYKKAALEYGAAIQKLTLIDNYIEVARIRINLALINIKLKEWDKAKNNIRLAKTVLMVDKFPEDAARCIATSGHYHEAKKEYPEALTTYKKALVMLEKERSDLREISEQLGNIGFIYFKLKQYKDAIAHLLRAVGLADRLRFYPHLPEYFTWIGEAYLQTDEKPVALSYFYNALIADKTAENPSGIGLDLHNIGKVLLSMGRYSEAADYLTRSIRIHTTLRRSDRIRKDLNLLMAIAKKTKDHKRLKELTVLFNKLPAERVE